MQVVGSVSTVQARLEELAERTAADEILVTTMVHDHGERLRSYERLADAFGLGRAPVSQAARG